MAIIRTTKQNLVAVIIPIYREYLSNIEDVSIRQCADIFGVYKKIVVHPAKVDGARIAATYGLDGAEAFPNSCFASYHNYNRTLMEAYFYARFLQYKYVLIYQLDSFVFADSLRDWCVKGYHYIGAPLGEIGEDNYSYSMNGYVPFWSRWKSYCFGNAYHSPQLLNGGYSLRRTMAFYIISRIFRKKTQLWGKNEDLFWSAIAPLYFPFFRIPSAEVASKFALMVDAQNWIDHNNGVLPFGCHGWDRYEADIWKPHIDAFGYSF